MPTHRIDDPLQQRMSPEHWQRVKVLFEEALELPDAARDTFLDRACATDRTLRQELASLLEAHAEAQDFLEDADDLPQLLLDGVGAPAEDAVEEGMRVGPYRLLRELGQGGMGAVYLAMRADAQYQKLVAIKLIKRGMDTDDVLRRFYAERQILAVLDHPSIARLLDGGVTEDGRPYFVMEYVDGLPLTRYCDQHHLGVEERLRLFLTVCEAVQYAHRNLVVHRDLKPSNILVTREGKVKLLDFGIAKLLSSGLAQDLATRPEARLLTPAYAAPEQVRGTAITTATDVYTLGVLLYELLTGHRPYAFPTRLQHEIERVICYKEPARPSTVVGRPVAAAEDRDSQPLVLRPEQVGRARNTTPERLRRRLAGDLDNIVAMAMRKEPERRYTSVEQLAEDLRRHLQGMPVAARKDTAVYRTSKFIRRHWWSVGTGVLVVLLLVTFSILMAAQERQTARERDKAEHVAAFLESLFLEADPAGRGSTMTVRELLDEGARRIDTLRTQPAVQAHMLDVMGRVYRSLGLFEQAEAMLHEAVQLRRHLLGRQHLDVAASLHHLAYLHFTMGDYQAAEAEYGEALRIRRERLGDRNAQVLESLQDLATLQATQGRYEASITLHREALALMRTLPGYSRVDEAAHLYHLGGILREQSRYAEADSLIREALAIYRATYGPDHAYVATTTHGLALVRLEQGQPENAETYMRQALAIYRARMGDEHPWSLLARAMLSTILREQGQTSAAERGYREVLALQRQHLRPDHPNLAVTLLGLGELLTERGQHAEAEALLREALVIRQEALPAGHWRIAEAQSALGACLTAQARYPEAEALLTASYPTIEATRGAANAQSRQAAYRLADLYVAWGKPELGAAYLRRLTAPTR